MLSEIQNFKKGDTFLKYQIIDIIGQGGMGIVYKALDCEMKRVVALKILFSNSETTQVKRFQRESRILARIKHPNVVPINTAGEHMGRCFIFHLTLFQ